MPDLPETAAPAEPRYKSVEEAARIYLLPNLFTAGNMMCGFLAMQRCIEARYTHTGPDAGALAFADYRMAVYLILGACVCDMFDGRVARASRRESLFGAEFDSIADTVSFGVAPAFMIFFLLLNPGEATGFVADQMRDFSWVFAFLYLLSVGVRLARFNVITNPLVPGSDKRKSTGEFMGLPSPAAAGMIGSLVLLLTTANAPLAYLKPLMPPLVLLIAYIMVSNIPYPSFKHISWNTGARAKAFIGIILFGILVWKYFTYTIPALFLAYIFFGILRDIRRRFFMNREQLAQEDIPDEQF